MSCVLPLEGVQSVPSVGQSLVEVRLDYYGTELYRGPAQVRHVESVEAGLRIGLALDAGMVDLQGLHRLTARLAFRRTWQARHREIVPTAAAPADFGLWLLEKRAYLAHVRDFLGQIEYEGLQGDRVTREQNLTEFFEEARPLFFSELDGFRNELNLRVDHFTQVQHRHHRQLTKDALGEFFMECPLVYRSVTRPLGYPGDYEMMNMLYRAAPEGDTLFARLLNEYARTQRGSRATVNRLRYFKQLLLHTLGTTSKPRLRVASVGCGAAREIFDLLSEHPEMGTRLDIALVDQDEHAIQHCERTLTPLSRETEARIEFIASPVADFLSDSDLGASLGLRDLVYCAGLFDYLDDRIFVQLAQVLFRSLAHGGELVVGNMAPQNESRYLMEYLMDWHLIYRSRKELLGLSENLSRHASAGWVDSEPEGLILFLHLRR